MVNHRGLDVVRFPHFCIKLARKTAPKLHEKKMVPWEQLQRCSRQKNMLKHLVTVGLLVATRVYSEHLDRLPVGPLQGPQTALISAEWLGCTSASVD
jgi:hypothetical protein